MFLFFVYYSVYKVHEFLAIRKYLIRITESADKLSVTHLFHICESLLKLRFRYRTGFEGSESFGSIIDGYLQLIGSHGRVCRKCTVSESLYYRVGMFISFLARLVKNQCMTDEVDCSYNMLSI